LEAESIRFLAACTHFFFATRQVRHYIHALCSILNLKLSREKNQVMKLTNDTPTTNKITIWPDYLIVGLFLTAFLWGCAVAPTRKLDIKDLSGSFQAGAIISTKAGKAVTFDELLADLNNCRITYIGEKHTSASDHKIQLEILRAVFKQNPNMAVGMEMFDHTYQDVLDMWSAGELDEKSFLRKTQWYANWGFDFSLYREILDFIKDNHIRLVGLNIPGYIPARIREGGIENLQDEDKKHLPAEIDTSNKAHREYVQKVFDHHQHIKGRVEFEDFYTAQVVWEDAMAQAVAQNLNDGVMVVLAGNGHIQFKYGIPDRAYKRTGEPFRTIYLAPVGSEVPRDIADYIWVTQ
jgi:uncharacterized iron-regulated protein